jgi:glycosyltransferase involved in cell wall biosynthesis
VQIAYVTTYDASDLKQWSGLGSYILRSLEAAGVQASTIGNLKEIDLPFVSKVKRAFYTRALSKKYLKDRDPSVLKSYAAQVQKQLNQIETDVVFSPGTVPIAYLKTDKPIVFYTDATFAGMLDFYPWFTNLSQESIKQGNRMEQRALTNCRLAIYASQWAADSAIKYYDVDPDKVKVVPFGANMSCDRDEQAITEIAEQKPMDICKLLLLGVDWHRKGGDRALEVAQQLTDSGLPTELHVVGIEELPVSSPLIHNHGFISKKTEAGEQQLNQLLSESHFLILPSVAECFGIVFSEASSYGLPSLATRVGGIPTAVQDGKNGWTFALDDSADAYCQQIRRLMSSKPAYTEMALSSFREYKDRLNWDASGKRICELIKKHCGK